MKRILSVLLIFGVILSLSACGNNKGRVLYNVDLDKYIKVENYKGIEIDTKSDQYKQYYDSITLQDVVNNDLYVNKKEGKVADGDMVNIDFEGKMDGEAFEGGTAKGYNLEIGSDSFIDGFEDGLIGKKIGSTVDLELTFPDNYGSEELAGEDVVFTVKINYVITEEKRKPEDYYKDLGYKSVEEYYESVKELTINNMIFSNIAKDIKYEKYPEKDVEFLTEIELESYELAFKNNNITKEEYVASLGQSVEEFQESIVNNQVKPNMQQQMIIYSIFDKEEMSLTKDEVENKVKEIFGEKETEDYSDEFKKYYAEYSCVSDKVVTFLNESAKIK